MAVKRANPKDLLELCRRVLALVKLQWPRLVLAMLCMMMIALLTPAKAYLVKPVVDDIFVNQDMRMLKFIPFAIIAIYVLEAVFLFGQSYIMNYVGHSLIKRLRDRLYSHLQMLPLSFFHKRETGVLMARITNDVTIIKGMVSNAAAGMVKDSFSIIGLLCLIFYLELSLIHI